MKQENLAIISNEKTQNINDKVFCDNIDMKSIPEGLSQNFNIELFLRKSKVDRISHRINLKKIFISANIFDFLHKIWSRSEKHKKFLVISLSPFTFFACLLLFILKKRIFLYLRSDGYEEYRCYSKFFGPIIYHIMFIIASKITDLIACRSHLLRKKTGFVVSPSQLNEKWFSKRKEPNLNQVKILYVGRIKKEKGIFSFLNLIKKIEENVKIKIINSEKKYDKKLVSRKVEIINFVNENDSIIEAYDDHNIFILPSFTEAHPQVLDESLARLRPVIIFTEISHVKRDREGVFVIERKVESLEKVIKFIMKNYFDIQKKMIKNNLPTKKAFLDEISQIIKNEKSK